MSLVICKVIKPYDSVVTLIVCAGYHVKPTDGSHFVKLFADAQFYSRTYRF